ncbi:MAG TPA: hypothetical protein VF544_20950 [Pyrinomonadaceae bacterium]|jgi:hypothetical protein
MNALRVYVDRLGADSRARPAVFYSRRAEGPYYCWLEDESGRWRVSRVHLSEESLRMLSMTRWKDVPVTLQTMLNDHYLE